MSKPIPDLPDCCGVVMFVVADKSQSVRRFGSSGVGPDRRIETGQKLVSATSFDDEGP
jgi:hypothetical protein